MNRTKKRQQDRRVQKLSKTIEKLTPRQLELVDVLSEQKADKLLDVFKSLITESVLEAMRMNHISLERANKVIEKANEIMEEKVNEHR
jgi:hypothetical protein